MSLAYNLKTSDGLHCFDEVLGELEDIHRRDLFVCVDPTPISQIAKYTDFQILAPMETEEDRARVAKAFSYLAASYMRLYTKSAENFMKIDSDLVNRFTKFYSYSFPFSNYRLTFDAVKVIKLHLEPNPTLKNTFYNFLYARESNPRGREIKGFLYEIHVSYTGLQAYVLFCRVMGVLKAPQGDHALDMWRFGRIFDSSFLSSLQMKNSKFFAAVCANVLRILGKGENAGVMNIYQLVNMDEGQKVKVVAYAERLIHIHTHPEQYVVKRRWEN